MDILGLAKTASFRTFWPDADPNPVSVASVQPNVAVFYNLKFRNPGTPLCAHDILDRVETSISSEMVLCVVGRATSGLPAAAPYA